MKDSSNLLIPKNVHSALLTKKLLNQNLQNLLQTCKDLGLTKREAECMPYLIRGMSAKRIGRAMGLADRTIECHLDNVKVKLNFNTRFEIIDRLFKNLLPSVK